MITQPKTNAKACISLIHIALCTKETLAKVGERDEVQGARRAESEIVWVIQRDYEHAATLPFAPTDSLALKLCLKFRGDHHKLLLSS